MNNRFSIHVRGRDFFLRRRAQAGSGAHPITCLVAPGVKCEAGYSFHLVPGLKMRADIPTLRTCYSVVRN